VVGSLFAGEGLEHAKAVDERHVQIEQDQVEFASGEPAQGQRPTVRLLDLAEDAERPRKHRPDRSVVVDDEEVWHVALMVT
jgi:hypothetical protein